MPKETQGQSLNDEALRTLMAQVESIISSRPHTVETFSDVTYPSMLALY